MKNQRNYFGRMMSAVFHLYYDGFKNMSVGKTLWVVILVKLFIIFFVLKLFFFPNFIKQHSQEGKESDFVATEITGRAR